MKKWTSMHVGYGSELGWRPYILIRISMKRMFRSWTDEHHPPSRWQRRQKPPSDSGNSQGTVEITSIAGAHQST
jgi:hypothetical protein